MTTLRTTSLLALGLLLTIGTAFAAGSWNDKVSFRYANATSLKVTEPEGFKVTITTTDGDKTGTIPELFPLADQDAFIKVTLASPQGDSWSKKIEVRAKQQTELAVSFKGDAVKPEPTKAGGRSYVGKMLNRGGGCGKAYDATMKADFLRSSDGAVLKSAQIDANKVADVEVEGGKYDVRIYVWAGQDWKYILTSSQEVSRDGWVLGFGCPKGSKTATLVTQ